VDLNEPDGRKEDEQKFRASLLSQNEAIAKAFALAEEFVTLLKERKRDQLSGWLERARNSAQPDVKGFATGIEQDRAAVEAAFEMEWSNGQVEGQVNRLKLLKRQMYGRAKFDLLRARVLRR
jgi:transposase